MFYLGLLGFLVTLYAIKVERSNEPALCDIKNRMSCSRVLKSEYNSMIGRLLGLKKNHPLNFPNTYYGILYYTIVMLYDFIEFPYKYNIMLTMVALSCLASLGLAYILYYKLQDFCVVCVTTYIINYYTLYTLYTMSTLSKSY